MLLVLGIAEEGRQVLGFFSECLSAISAIDPLDIGTYAIDESSHNARRHRCHRVPPNAGSGRISTSANDAGPER